MPELPEVEVVKLYLEAKLLHHTITKLEILNPKSFIGDPKLVEGQKIVKFSRTGKQLSIYLSNKLILLVHLKMTGQLIYQSPLSKGDLGGLKMLGHPTKFEKYPNKSTRLIFHFSPSCQRGGRGEIVFFNDQRKFGWIKLFTQEKLAEFQKNLGLDLFDPKFTSDYFFTQLKKSSRPVKSVLLDQHFFAGIGNIYANDALFLAKIHPKTVSNTINLKQAKLIHKCLLSITQQSILAGGSTARDNKYIHPDGSFGQNQFYFRVYQRAGEPCLKCKTSIKKIKIGGRGTFFCPHCQLKCNKR